MTYFVQSLWKLKMPGATKWKVCSFQKKKAIDIISDYIQFLPVFSNQWLIYIKFSFPRISLNLSMISADWTENDSSVDTYEI